MNDIEKYIIKSLITNTRTEKEIGFNSALITLLKAMAEGIPLHLQEAELANNAEENEAVPLTIHQKMMRKAFKSVLGDTVLFRSINLHDIDTVISMIPSNKLAATKNLKNYTNLGLKQSKDIIDLFSASFELERL